MAEAVDLTTWRGRVKAARIEAGFGGPTLSALMGRNKNWSRDLEIGHGSPDPELLAELARVLGKTVQWIVTGEESGRSEFLDSVASFEARLDDRGKRAVIANARAQADEADARRLSSEEAEALEMLRRLTPEVRALQLAALRQSVEMQPRTAGTPLEGPARIPRSAQAG